MRAAALPFLVAVLSFPAVARAQPGAEPAAPPEAQPPPGDTTAEQSMCWRGHCGPDRPRRFALGIAGGRLERADGSDARLAYGEFGGGLMLRGRRFALALDLRAGARRSEASVGADAGVTAAMTSPSDGDDEWERDRYRRARLMLLFQC